MQKVLYNLEPSTYGPNEEKAGLSISGLLLKLQRTAAMLGEIDDLHLAEMTAI